MERIEGESGYGFISVGHVCVCVCSGWSCDFLLVLHVNSGGGGGASVSDSWLGASPLTASGKIKYFYFDGMRLEKAQYFLKSSRNKSLFTCAIISQSDLLKKTPRRR